MTNLTKLGRLTVFAILFGIFAFYVQHSTVELNKNQIGMALTEEKKYLFDVPSFSICGQDNSLRDGNINGTHDGAFMVRFVHGTFGSVDQHNLTYKNMSPEEPGDGWQWDTFAYDVSDVGTVQCDHLTVSKRWKLPAGMSYWFSFWLDVRGLPQQFPLIYIIVGSSDDLPVIRSAEDGSMMVSSEPPRDENSEDVSFHQIKMGSFEHLSRDEQLCQQQGEEEPEENTYHRCLVDFINQTHKCLGKYGATLGCDRESGKAATKKVTQLMLHTPNQVYKETGCLMPCLRQTYEIAHAQKVTLNASDSPMKGKSTHRLTFFVPRPAFTVRQEFRVFSLSSYLANCAGMGGIFLGFSFLTFYDWVTEKGRRLWQRWKKANGANFSKEKH